MKVQKFILTIIFITAVSVSTFGQVLNARGLKVVEKVEMELYTYDETISGWTDEVRCIDHAKYSFSYNISNQLISMVYSKCCEYIKAKRFDHFIEKRFTLSNGKLTRKDYENGKLKRDYTFNYVLDGNVITKREVFNHATNGTNECLRSDDEYTYVTDTDGTPILSRDTYKWYVRMPGTNFFQKGDGEDGAMIGRYYKENGNFYKAISVVHYNGSHSDNPIRYQDYDYSDLPNDTNVNWLGFPTDSSRPNNLEMLTEWVNVRSEHLLNRYERYEYQYSYENGNISTIEVYSYGKLRARLIITYKMN